MIRTCPRAAITLLACLLPLSQIPRAQAEGISIRIGSGPGIHVYSSPAHRFQAAPAYSGYGRAGARHRLDGRNRYNLNITRSLLGDHRKDYGHYRERRHYPSARRHAFEHGYRHGYRQGYRDAQRRSRTLYQRWKR